MEEVKQVLCLEVVLVLCGNHTIVKVIKFFSTQGRIQVETVLLDVFFDSVLSSTATSITVTSADENYLILTPGGTCTVSPSGNFPDGYLITIKNLHGSNTVNFNSAGAFGQTVKQYVYDKTNTSWNEVEVEQVQ